MPGHPLLSCQYMQRKAVDARHNGPVLGPAKPDPSAGHDELIRRRLILSQTPGTPMNKPLKLGVIGLGRAFTLMLPTFTSHPLIKMVAASDPRAEARERFAREFGANVFED